MNLSQQDSDLIDKYLQQKLSKEEVEFFQQRMTDDVFAEEVALREQIKAGLTVEARSELRRQMNVWDASESQKVVPLSGHYRWAIAATILVLLGLVFYLFRTTGNDAEALFLSYYKQYPNLVDPIVKGEESAEYSISQLYELGRYEAVIDHVELDSLRLFYLALAQLEMGDFEASIDLLKDLSDKNDYRFHDAAEWYLALAYLRTGDAAAAETLLDSISLTFRHDHRGEADSLLRELRR